MYVSATERLFLLSRNNLQTQTGRVWDSSDFLWFAEQQFSTNLSSEKDANVVNLSVHKYWIRVADVGWFSYWFKPSWKWLHIVLHSLFFVCTPCDRKSGPRWNMQTDNNLCSQVLTKTCLCAHHPPALVQTISTISLWTCARMLVNSEVLHEYGTSHHKNYQLVCEPISKAALLNVYCIRCKNCLNASMCQGLI